MSKPTRQCATNESLVNKAFVLLNTLARCWVEVQVARAPFEQKRGIGGTVIMTVSLTLLVQDMVGSWFEILARMA